MPGSESSAQSIGVVWHMARHEVPAAPASAPAARFSRVGPEAETELARAMGRDGPALVRQRFVNESHAYAAWAGGQLAAYGWISFDKEYVGELGLHLRLLPGEAYIWDCLTLPLYRGQGLYTALLGFMARALRDQGVQSIWIGAGFENLSSQAGIGRSGFTAVADLMAAPAQPGERRRLGWLRARPGIEAGLVAAARRVYLGDCDEVWLTVDQA